MELARWRLAALATITLQLQYPVATAAPVHQTAPAVLPALRDQAEIREEWSTYRTTVQLPKLMQANGVQHWILSQRE